MNPPRSSRARKSGEEPGTRTPPGLSINPVEDRARFWKRVRTIVPLIVLAAGLATWYYYAVWRYREPPPPKRLERRLRLEEAGRAPLKHERVKYAVLIVGPPNDPKDGRERSLINYDTETAYSTLCKLGFQPENMYVLKGDGKQDQWHSYPVDDVASKESVRLTFAHLRKVVDDNDLLFVYYGAHGGNVWVNKDPDTGRRLPERVSLSFLGLQNQDLLQTTFYDYLKGIRPEVGVLYFGQCRGGGFADELVRRSWAQKNLRRFVAISVVDGYSNSLLGLEAGLMMAYDDLLRDEADRNRDGAVSLYEALLHAEGINEHGREAGNKPSLVGSLDPRAIFLER